MAVFCFPCLFFRSIHGVGPYRSSLLEDRKKKYSIDGQRELLRATEKRIELSCCRGSKEFPFDKFLFFKWSITNDVCLYVLYGNSLKNIPQLPSVVLPDSVDGYYRLWGKVRGIWKHLRQRHLHQFDWFLKADDDTYIVVDNLRTFLDRRFSSEQSTAAGDAVWFGARLRNRKVPGGYHSGGAGYVLSRRALELFDDGRSCSQMNFGYEDLEMGKSFVSPLPPRHRKWNPITSTASDAIGKCAGY